MVGGLITLSLRLSLAAAGLLWRGAEEASRRALALVRCAQGKGRSRADVGATEIYAGPVPPGNAAAAEEDELVTLARHESGNGPAPAPIAARAVEHTVVPLAPVTSEPAHVSAEPELVEELAEPGAEEGAGAQVSVREPWDGYGRMTARDVIARLAAADDVELAAVDLYERAYRKRRTVLRAVERRLGP